MAELAKPEKRQVNPSRIIAALAITVIVFIIGVFIGQLLTESKTNTLENIQTSLALELTELQLQAEVLEQNPCESDEALKRLGGRLDSVAEQLETLENQLGKTDKRVIELKKPYTLLLVRHYLLYQKRVDYCLENPTLLLFFLSNEGTLRELSENQGFILKYLQGVYGYDKLKVYAIDTGLDLAIVTTLKELYKVTEVPTLVINKKTYSGFKTQEQIESAINQNN
ncbi:MAG: hypothetical protein ABH817_00675 [archaeon]